MRKHRRDRVLNSRAQLARISSSIGYRRLAIFQKKVIEIRIRVNKRQGKCVNVQGKLACISAEFHFRSDKSRHVGDDSRSMMRDREVLRQEVSPRQHAANSKYRKHAKFNFMCL